MLPNPKEYSIKPLRGIPSCNQYDLIEIQGQRGTIWSHKIERMRIWHTEYWLWKSSCKAWNHFHLADAVYQDLKSSTRKSGYWSTEFTINLKASANNSCLRTHLQNSIKMSDVCCILSSLYSVENKSKRLLDSLAPLQSALSTWVWKKDFDCQNFFTYNLHTYLKGTSFENLQPFLQIKMTAEPSHSI